jgi:hypothetical protein
MFARDAETWDQTLQDETLEMTAKYHKEMLLTDNFVPP